MLVAARAPGVIVFVVALVHTVLRFYGRLMLLSTPSLVSRTCLPHRPLFHGRWCGALDVAVNLRDAFVLIMLVNI